MRLIAFHSSRLSRLIIALMLAGLVLLLNAMAAAPALHQWVHPDADETGHQCAVTLFAHAQVDTAAVAVVIPTPLLLTTDCPTVEISIVNLSIGRLPAGRAPPVSFFQS